MTDPLRWDQGFVDAAIYGLASRVCFELTGKEERVKALTQMWQMALANAGAEMANESSGLNRTGMPEALQARGYNDGLQAFGQTWTLYPWLNEKPGN